MKSFIIAWKDIQIRLRDRKGIIMTLLMPLLLTAILGAALNGTVNSDTRTLPKMKIAVYDGDQEALAQGLTEGVLHHEELKPRVTVIPVESPDEVNSLVLKGKADAGIVIPEGFSESVLTGNSANIELVQDPGKSMIGQIVQTMIVSYTDRVSAVSASAREVTRSLAESVARDPSIGLDLQAMGEQTAAALRHTAEQPNVSVVEQPSGNKAISGMQYYAAAMLAMFLLFNATTGAKSILNERSTMTLSRLISSPTNYSSILFGKFLGTLAFSVLQFATFMLVTGWSYGVGWGDNWTQTMAIGTAYAVAVSGLSMAIAATVRTEQAADLISGLGIQVFAVLGGSMIPLSKFPQLFQKIALITPNAWSLQGFLDVMTGATWLQLLQPILVLSAIGIVSLTFGTWRLRALGGIGS